MAFILLLMVCLELLAWCNMCAHFPASFVVSLCALEVQMEVLTLRTLTATIPVPIMATFWAWECGVRCVWNCGANQSCDYQQEEYQAPAFISWSWTFLDLLQRFWMHALWACFLLGILLGFCLWKSVKAICITLSKLLSHHMMLATVSITFWLPPLNQCTMNKESILREQINLWMAHANQVPFLKKNLHYKDNYNYNYFMVLYLLICCVCGRRCRDKVGKILLT